MTHQSIWTNKRNGKLEQTNVITIELGFYRILFFFIFCARSIENSFLFTNYD